MPMIPLPSPSVLTHAHNCTRLQATGDASNLYLSRKKVGLVSSWADTRHLPPSVKKELQVRREGGGSEGGSGPCKTG